MSRVSNVQPPAYDRAEQANRNNRVEFNRRRAASAGAERRQDLGRPLPKVDSVALSYRAHRAAAVAGANTEAKLAAVPAELAPTAPDGGPSVKTYSPDDIASLIESFGQKAGEDGFNLAFDLNGDGIIDSQDLNQALAGATPAEPTQVEQVQSAFGLARGDEGFNAEADLNKDGVVNSADLNEALKNS